MTTVNTAKLSRLRFKIPQGVELVIPLVVAMVIFAIINPNFLRLANLSTVLMGIAFVGIVAIGQTVVVITGNFDLSVGATAALSAVIGAKLMVAGLPIPVAILVLFVVGIVVGLINGLFTIIGVPSFIVTIATLYMASGVTLFMTGGQPVYPLPVEVTSFGTARPLGFSVSFLALIVLLVAVTLFLRFTRTGRYAYAAGGAPEVAKLVGVSVPRVVFGAFVFSGITASFAGLLQMSALASASTTIGDGWELASVAAVIIGGASIFGGSGNPVGTIFGVLLLGLVSNGLVSVGVPANWQTLATGAIMIMAVSVDIVRRRARVLGRRTRDPEHEPLGVVV